MIWSQGKLGVVFSPMKNCFSGKKGRVFFIASWRVMKNGFITATQREESHGDCSVMFLRRLLGRIFTLRRLCCVFGGTRSLLFIMSCWNWTKPSLGNGIKCNRCVWAEHSAKNGQNTSRGTQKWFYHDISVKKRDSAFLKIQLKSLWNSTSSDAQQIFFWPSVNNTALEEIKKIEDFLQFSTSTSTFCIT